MRSESPCAQVGVWAQGVPRLLGDLSMQAVLKLRATDLSFTLSYFPSLHSVLRGKFYFILFF